MGFSRDDIQANRNYFLEKLRSEKQPNDVLQAVEGNAPLISSFWTHEAGSLRERSHTGCPERRRRGTGPSSGFVAEGQGDRYVLRGA